LQKRKCARADRQHQQQRGRGQPIVAFGQDIEFGIVARGVERAFPGRPARGNLRRLVRLVIGSTVGIGAVEVGDRGARQAGQMRHDMRIFEKRLQFAHRNREKERRIRAVVADRAKAVDTQHPAAGIEQRPARIARAELRGVQNGIELPRRPP
jgi:hypothetical protein